MRRAKLLALAAAILAAAWVGLAGQDEWIAGSAPVDDAYQWELTAAQPIWERDWVSAGVAWVFDDADRSQSRTETTTRQEVTRETVTNPETGEETTTERIVEIPETTTTVIPGDVWDGVGAYAVTPIWRFAALKVNAGVVTPASDLSMYWPVAGLSYTFSGLETESYVFSSFEVGGVMILDESMMYALTVGLTW
jgi:hypothetical protein